MASSYTFAEIFNMVVSGKSRNIEEQNKTSILNTAQNLIWRAFDWRWTMSALAPFWLIPRLDVYGAPLVIVPTDWDGLRLATLHFISTGVSEPSRRPLRVTKTIQVSGRTGIPDSIAYVPELTKFRVSPRPADSICAPRYYIDGEYKKLPTKLTAQSYVTATIPSDDKHLNMWRKAVEWAYLDFSGDQRAGGIQPLPSGQPSYFGALGNAMAEIQVSAAEEGLALGDPHIHPESGLLISDYRYQYGPHL